jgi:hypothetical protein
MKTLKSDDVIRVMKEEYAARTRAILEQVDLAMTANLPHTGEESVISPELKVRHKGSQIRYTVQSVGPRDVILRTPEGDTFLVNAEEIENDYELD